MTVFSRRFLLALCLALFGTAAASAARAQDEAGLFPPQTAAAAPEYQLSPVEDTHPLMRLTPEKSEIINLDAEAKSLIIGNPRHLNVIMDTTKRLVLVPRNPGATQFTVLDETGKVIMQRHVIVASPMEKYVRIRRNCTLQRGACEDMSVYYCPEGLCHQVDIVTTSTAVPPSGNRAVAPSAGGGGGLGQASSNYEDSADSFNEQEGVNPFDLLMDALRNAAENSAPSE